MPVSRDHQGNYQRDFVCEECRNDVIVVGADREVIGSITHCIVCKPDQTSLGVHFVGWEPTGEPDDHYRDFD
jgi:hypothetical protein